MAELSSCDRECMAHKQKDLSDSLQKKFANPWPRHTGCYFYLLLFQGSGCSFLLWQVSCPLRKQDLCLLCFVEPPNIPRVSVHASRKAGHSSMSQDEGLSCLNLDDILSAYPLPPVSHQITFPSLFKKTDCTSSCVGHVYSLAIAV